MINQYPLWKYLLILAVLAVGALYALPNLYGEDPALQISSSRGTPIDMSTRTKVQDTLRQAGIASQPIEAVASSLLVRFSNTDDQLKAKDAVSAALGDDYITALNLAPATPGWLTSLAAAPMYLGLDLRGGVHFQMQVDTVAALAQAEERYVGEVRTLLRDKKLRYLTVARQNTGSLEVKFRDAEERDQALNTIKKEYPSLVIKDEERSGEYYLLVSISEKEKLEISKFAVQQNITALRNRVNELGVSEPVILQQGADRIVVQLAGVQDTARAKDILGATATLEFRLVDTEHNVQDAVAGRVPLGSKLYKERKGAPVLLQKRVIITGQDITDASSGLDQRDGSSAVFISLDGKGSKMMYNITKDNVGKPMAVVFIENKTETRMVDGKAVKTKKTVEEVINIATIREALSKRFQITGLDGSNEARDLALLLRAGALAAPMDIVEERTVGPSLGAENIAKGFNSTLIGFAAIAIFMSVYYRVFGVIASVSLFVNMVLLLSVLSVLQATLTLPGIAGIALTIGMAIDANVLIFERIREELRNGNTPQAAIHAGYERAWGTILDSNITTLIAGFALFLLGSGPVRGFAVVLCIGILTSMFSAVMVSRAMVNLIYGGRKLAKLPI
ncbi:MAG: protein translocase subunit SecD [Gammaproteobacteria bacterium]|nr:protein translocase subunit SecD [Gammaproteobacteria bacterium]